MSWRRLVEAARPARSFSVLTPLPELVAALNDYRPFYLASYPTMLMLLAGEQAAGRLRIAPALLWSGGERLSAARRAELEAAFRCPVANEYGASECMSIAVGCREGALHVNADWVVLEPVDRNYRPTPPGVPSHSVLLTNLANRVQPVIRYDLGDSVTVRPGRCRCGSVLPMIEVEGRRDDIPEFRRRDGTAVRLVPLALATVVEQAVDLSRFQLVQMRRTGCACASIPAKWLTRRQGAQPGKWHGGRCGPTWRSKVCLTSGSRSMAGRRWPTCRAASGAR